MKRQIKIKIMNLKERINLDYMTAFKTKNVVAKNLLSVVKGEIQTIEKNTGVDVLSDEEITKILTKTKKSLDETNSKFPSEQTQEEIKIVESYLPTEMSESEIETKITEFISNGASNIGDIMKAFAGLPADKKNVSALYNKLK
jgi:uncharacterized protein YqeY